MKRKPSVFFGRTYVSGPYQSPVIEVVELAVEAGIAQSADSTIAPIGVEDNSGDNGYWN